jgi:hypothetical protein
MAASSTSTQLLTWQLHCKLLLHLGMFSCLKPCLPHAMQQQAHTSTQLLLLLLLQPCQAAHLL